MLDRNHRDIQHRSWSSPGIGTESTTLRHRHGQPDREREERDIMDDDVCGRYRFVYRDKGRGREKAGGVEK